MIRENNHRDGIVGLSTREIEFRRQYKLHNGTIKGATRAYQRQYLSDRKRTQQTIRHHNFEVLGQCSPELEIQLMFEGEGK